MALDYRNLLISAEYQELMKRINDECFNLADMMIENAGKGGMSEEMAFLAGQIKAYREIDKIAQHICKEKEDA